MAIPGPSPQELAKKLHYQDKEFNPKHLRPSGIGNCARAQVLTVLNALYPGEKDFQPDNPQGKAGLKAAAVNGDIREDDYYEKVKDLYPGKVYGGQQTQFELKHPYLFNPDNEPITSHPDLFVPDIPLDEEIKTASEASRKYLPKGSHVKQVIYRYFLWNRAEQIKPYIRIVYLFRALEPEFFELVPEGDGLRAQWDGGFYSWDYIKSLDERMKWMLECVDKKEIPPREGDSPHYYECRYEPLGAECPWRESCWAEELAEERTPPVRVDNLADKIRELAEVDENRRRHARAAEDYKKRKKQLQKELAPVFEEFDTSKLSALDPQGREVVVKRKYVEVPEKTQKGFSFWQYDVIIRESSSD